MQADQPGSGHRGVSIDEVAGLVGHVSTRTTEVVYRRELRPMITTDAEIMDEVFGAHFCSRGQSPRQGPHRLRTFAAACRTQCRAYGRIRARPSYSAGQEAPQARSGIQVEGLLINGQAPPRPPSRAARRWASPSAPSKT